MFESDEARPCRGCTTHSCLHLVRKRVMCLDGLGFHFDFLKGGNHFRCSVVRAPMVLTARHSSSEPHWLEHVVASAVTSVAAVPDYSVW